MSTAGCELRQEDCYAVMGNPVAHSKSPLIHRLFADQTEQSLRYDALLVDRDDFAHAVAAFFIAGGKGLNITVPFKQEACTIADELTPRAQRAGAVNTLLMHGSGELLGDNTDGVGLVRDLTGNLGLALDNKRIVLLGAGGAARGVLSPLLEQQPAQLVIANRTYERALQLCNSYTGVETLQASSLDDLAGRLFDVVINATAAGLSDQVPALPPGVIGPRTACYDMMYASDATAFQRYARQQGAQQAFDGLGMLVEQAAESFFQWRGVHPETAPVIATLRTST